MGWLKKQLLKVIEWTDNTSDTIVYKFPVSDRYEIMKGSKIVVRESQAAIFVTEGQIADVFTAGTWELDTNNLPIITQLKSWKYAFETPIRSDVYFVNLKRFNGMKWGTMNPIMMRDKDFGMIRIAGHGEYSFHVSNPSTFMRECFGTKHLYTTEEIENHLRSIIVAELSDLLGECQIPALDLAANYLELGDKARDNAMARFEALGLTVDQILIRNLKLPEEVEAAIDKRTSIGIFDDKMGSYAQYESIQAMRDAAKNPGAGGMFAAAGMGMGMGAQLGGQFMNNINSAKDVEKVKCSKCGASMKATAKFCPECGAKRESDESVQCPSCGASVQKGSKFCPECGAKLVRSCPKCGCAVKPGIKFCPNCGEKLG